MILASGSLARNALASKTDDIVSLDELALLVEEKTAIKITVPGNTEPGAIGQHRVPCDSPVFWQQRVRNAVRKSAVRLVTYLGNLQRQLFFEQIQDRPSTTVSGIDDDLEWPQDGSVDVAEQVADISDAVLIWRDRTDPVRGIEGLPASAS